VEKKKSYKKNEWRRKKEKENKRMRICMTWRGNLANHYK
jgi:hypothetical protein